MKQATGITPAKMLLLGTGWFGMQVLWAFHSGPMPLFLKDFSESKFAISAIPFAAVMGVGYAYLLDRVPEERTAEFVGFSVISSSAAQILGALLGGALIDAFGYRSIFPVAAGMMLVGLVILQLVRPRAIRADAPK